ncbi:hypothetical protein MRX96_046083 [Rhipicephalus microplus]
MLCEMNGDTAFSCRLAPHLPGKDVLVQAGEERRLSEVASRRFRVRVRARAKAQPRFGDRSCREQHQLLQEWSTARGGSTVSRVTRHRTGTRNRASIAL